LRLQKRLGADDAKGGCRSNHDADGEAKYPEKPTGIFAPRLPLLLIVHAAAPLIN